MLEKSSKEREVTMSRINNMRITKWINKYSRIQNIKANLRKRWSETSKRLKELDKTKRERIKVNRTRCDEEFQERVYATHSNELAKQLTSETNIMAKNAKMQVKFIAREEALANHYKRWEEMQRKAKEIARAKILSKELLLSQRRQVFNTRQEIISEFIKSQKQTIQIIPNPDPTIAKPSYYAISPELLGKLPFPKEKKNSVTTF